MGLLVSVNSPPFIYSLINNLQIYYLSAINFFTSSNL